MSVEAIIATQVIDTTSIGRSVMTAANAAAVRTAIDAQVTLVSATNIKTVNGSSLLGSGDLAVSGLSGTGAVDNAVLRADGTGGATLQNSAIVIADNYTASPNNTVNHASLQVTGGTTNVSVSIVPKGTGAFTLAVPDGTTTGGNVRGVNSIDLQTERLAATEVASGASSVVIGTQSKATGFGGSVAIGYRAISSSTNALALGSSAASGQNSVALNATASGEYSFATGRSTVASGANAMCLAHAGVASASYSFGLGFRPICTRTNMLAYGGNFIDQFSGVGSAQFVVFILSKKTTDATSTTLMLDSSTTRLTIPSGIMMMADILISGIKSDGSAAATYKRKVAIKNVAGTTSLVGSVETIGTDHEDNASTNVAITADDTNDALQINVTGIAAETWRWVAVVEGLEIAYGT